MALTNIDGGCLCGSVRYRIQGAATNSMICHCRTCRRAAAAPVVAWVTFPIERFRFVKGEVTEYSSSAPVRRTFCACCGTPLTYTHADAPQFVDITTCSLDDPDSFPPTHHSWLRHDVGWLKFADGLPQFPESRNDRTV
jgi:hypothetical protein